MSVDLDRQLREYCRDLDEKQGALSFDDILERTGELQVIPNRHPSPPRRWIAVVAAALALLVVAIGILLLPAEDVTLDPVDQPTTTSIPFPATGPVEPGTYHIEPSEWNVAGFAMTMPEGWEAQDRRVSKYSDPVGEAMFYFVIVDAIYTDPCVGSGGDAANLMELGPSVDDLAQALLDQPHTVATGPVDTTLGGLPAKRIDLTVEDSSETATCNLNVPGHLQIWLGRPVDDYFVLLGDGTASVYILDVNGERQVFVTQHVVGTPAEVVSEMQTIVESITIDQ